MFPCICQPQRDIQKADDYFYHTEHVYFLPDLKRAVSNSHLVGLIHTTKETSFKSIKNQAEFEVFLVY